MSLVPTWKSILYVLKQTTAPNHATLVALSIIKKKKKIKLQYFPPIIIGWGMEPNEMLRNACLWGK